MELIFHPRAPLDARDIAGKYSAISEMLEQRFWKELDSCIDLIARFPERHHFDSSGLRRSNLKTFPYHLLFEERLGCIRVVVIRHNRRNPSFGSRRR